MNLVINNLSNIHEVIGLCKEIFHPSKEELINLCNEQDWITKINDGGLLIAAYVEGKLVGFSICFLKESKVLHIWNVGVLSQYRRMKIWQKMFEQIEAYAQKKKCFSLTLNTYEQKFPAMYQFALNRGFKSIKTEMVTGLVKTYFEKKI